VRARINDEIEISKHQNAQKKGKRKKQHTQNSYISLIRTLFDSGKHTIKKNVRFEFLICDYHMIHIHETSAMMKEKLITVARDTA